MENIKKVEVWLAKVLIHNQVFHSKLLPNALRAFLFNLRFYRIYLIMCEMCDKNISNKNRAYSGPSLGATIAPNLVPWVLKKIFSLEMVKNNMQTKCLFFQKICLKKCTHAFTVSLGTDPHSKPQPSNFICPPRHWKS